MNGSVIVISTDERVFAAAAGSGHSAIFCKSVDEAMKVRGAALVLADSEICGADDVKRLGERLCVPIIFVVSAGAADDLAVKPLDAANLSVRMDALIGRSRADCSDRIKVGELLLNNAAHRCTAGGAEIKLTPLEFKILWYLCERRGLVTTSKELFESIWGEEYLDSSGTVMPHIARIRKKLGAHNCIKTIWGVGYKVDDGEP